jgi:AcrR family transcriptional regulator
MAAGSKQKPLPSVWARPQSGAEQPALNRESIVREAIAMLDADGIEALSMRKLGARLNAGATSLYRHVATKDELMELAVDAIVAELPIPHADPDWRGAAEEAAHAFRGWLLRHPWTMSVLGQMGLAYLGPNLMAYMAGLAELFAEAGFADPAIATDAVLSYVVGMATTETAWLATVARSGEPEVDFIARLMPAAREAAAGHRVLAEAYDRTRDVAADPPAQRDAKFADALAVVLDGLALRLPG